MWLDQTTGCQTTTSPSVTCAPKPSLQSCPSTTAGPVDRGCAVPVPHTSDLCPLEAGTTRSECVTAATPAKIVCDFSNQENFSKSALCLPQMIHKSTVNPDIAAALGINLTALNSKTGISFVFVWKDKLLRCFKWSSSRFQTFICTDLGSAFCLFAFFKQLILHQLQGKKQIIYHLRYSPSGLIKLLQEN